MPTYEYFCPDCQVTFALQRRIAERESEAECPHCHTHKTNRVMSTFMMASDLVGASRPSRCGTCSPSPGACAACGVRR